MSKKYECPECMKAFTEEECLERCKAVTGEDNLPAISELSNDDYVICPKCGGEIYVGDLVSVSGIDEGVSEYDTVWQPVDESYMSDRCQDGVYLPIGDKDRARLEAALNEEVSESEDTDPEYYLERMEATHIFVNVTVPDEAIDDPEYDCTWWDFSTILSKQVDGVWYVWSEDPSDIGNIWYQSPYTKQQAYMVRDEAIEWIKQDRIYEGDDYIGQAFDKHISKLMNW